MRKKRRGIKDNSLLKTSVTGRSVAVISDSQEELSRGWGIMMPIVDNLGLKSNGLSHRQVQYAE